MAHEDLSREQLVKSSSDRAFGSVFSVVFLLVALWPLLHRNPIRWWSLGICVGILVIAIARPVLLALPNRLWTRLGVLLGHIVSPIALGLLFYAVLMPIGLLMRWAGKDPLRLRADPAAQSYWVPRTPPGPPPNSIENQF
jgi:hypothetical protein